MTDSIDFMEDSINTIVAGNNRQKWVRFFTHLIVITILFVLPEVIMSYSMPRHKVIPPGMYIKAATFVAVFYVNYYFIIDHSLLSGKHRTWKFIAYNLLIISLSILLIYIVWRYSGADRPHRHINEPETRHVLKAASFLLRDMVMVILTIALSVALRLSDKWTTFERTRQELTASQREYELNSLKSQLNPHFLFNTLNSIYALISICPEKAQKAVHELSGMLRYVLYETPSTVSLQQEIDFTRNYISLMMIRLGEKKVSAHLDISSYADARIAPLIFISLIENAFKYGNTGSADDRIEISITAHDGVVSCRTSNRYIPASGDVPRGGTGLANLQRRLHLLYGDRASLTIDSSNGKFISLLNIQLI